MRFLREPARSKESGLLNVWEMDGMPAIEITELGKVFKGGKGATVRALHGISLSVAQGEVFGFLGPNGAGKSTTIKSIMGQLTPTSGQVKIYGVPASDPAARLRIGYLPENPAFYDFLTAREYLYFVGRIFAMPETKIADKADEVLELLELTVAADRPVRGYSKGMVQRLGLAQALLHDPDVYILDEPMSGLDPLGRALVKDIIKKLHSSGKTIFFSTHITADVEMVCDRVGVIVEGKLQAVDRVSTILEQGETGYRIYVTSSQGNPCEHDISKSELPVFIARSSAQGDTIVRVEPRRKDLESFFLETVARGADERIKAP